MGKKVGRKPNEERDLLWYSRATKVLKGEMLRLGVSTGELQSKLEKIGVSSKQDALSKKINHGAFSFAFFLQCMRAMDVPNINLYMAFDPPNTGARLEKRDRGLPTNPVPDSAASDFLPDLGTNHSKKPKSTDDDFPPF